MGSRSKRTGGNLWVFNLKCLLKHLLRWWDLSQDRRGGLSCFRVPGYSITSLVEGKRKPNEDLEGASGTVSANPRNTDRCGTCKAVGEGGGEPGDTKEKLGVVDESVVRSHESVGEERVGRLWPTVIGRRNGGSYRGSLAHRRALEKTLRSLYFPLLEEGGNIKGKTGFELPISKERYGPRRLVA